MKLDIRHAGPFATFAMLGILVAPASAQVSIGADIVSRYVWRGTDFGESMSIQPALTFAKGGFEAGAWASYAVSPEAAGANESDLWFAYTIETSSGTISAGMVDYYFPAPDAAEFFTTDAHTFEPYVNYTGPEAFPVKLFAGVAYAPGGGDDDDHDHKDDHDHDDHAKDREASLYLEGSIPFSVGDTELNIHAGAVPGSSDFYGTNGNAVVNVGITATQPINVTDSFMLPVSVAYILNPYTERSFLVFGVSLSP